MNITSAAQAIGVDTTSLEVTGAIDEKNVLGVLANLAEGDLANADLFNDAVERVRRSRSAGVEDRSTVSARGGTGDTPTTQLRYRSEMADIFTDLAIDVGLRRQRSPGAELGASSDAGEVGVDTHFEHRAERGAVGDVVTTR